MTLGIYSQQPVILLPAMFASGLGVVFLLGALHSVIALMLIKRSNRQLSWKEMTLPLLIGFNIAMIQILATSLFRFLLIGSWAPFNL